MGIFDKILDGIKEEIKSELSRVISPDSAAAPETVPEPRQAAQSTVEEEPAYTRTFDTGDEYFAGIITDDKFPGYTIERSVNASTFDSSAHPRCYPITYLFRKDGAPVLAVLVMNRNQSRAMISVGTYAVLDDNRIPYIRFYKGMENREDYVIGRIRDNLI